MKMVEGIKAWLQKDTTGPKKFFQIAVLVVGGLILMALSVGIVGAFLAVTPLVTILVPVFLVIYGIFALVRRKS